MSRAQDDVPADAALHRRQSARQVRHVSRVRMATFVGDDESLEDAVLPTGCHDIGRKKSPKAKSPPRPGRRGGFKVWKTPFWKRRRQLWAERNAAERQLRRGE
jgi:hypothetical protein